MQDLTKRAVILSAMPVTPALSAYLQPGDTVVACDAGYRNAAVLGIHNNAGGNVAIIAVGSMVEETYKAIDMLEKENVHPAFVNPVFIKPMDTELIKRVAENHKHIIVVEEGIKKGGFGESVETFILESGIDADVQVTPPE